ncbi:hypothetical protein [Nocardia asteroides]|uniref:hypothetical protein n=1 Tax=Nocardia asteroides TaxID=1824 RepID=UPI00341CD13D
MPVRVEHAGPLTTAIPDRPAARNAVAGPTARALPEAFDADPAAPVPQTCLRSDRAELREAQGRPGDEATRIEFRHGPAALTGGALEGADRFAAGAGRHGSTDHR